MILSLRYTPPHLPAPSLSFRYCLPSANDKGMERKGWSPVLTEAGGAESEGEMGGRKVKIHFETHFQLGVHKLLSQVSQNGGP